MDVAVELRAILKREATAGLIDIPPDKKLAELGFDSIAVIETVFAIEDKFAIQLQLNNEQIAAMTFQDLCELVDRQLSAKADEIADARLS
jgi:acyl carrier protein